MKNLKEMVLCLTVIMIMGTLLCADCRNPVLHRVGGGKYTWAPNINFSEWSTHEQFYVGDWLYFGFDKHIYNVLEVNKTSYDNCIDKNFIQNITRGGRDVFNLTEERPYYFLSGRGHCFSDGMKLAVSVQEFVVPPLPAPFLPHNGSRTPIAYNGSPTSICTQIFQLVFLACAFVWTFLFNYFQIRYST